MTEGKIIKYSSHLSFRLSLRKIPQDLPRIIYLRSRRRYFDIATDTAVAVMRARLNKRQRDIMIVYREDDDDVLIITVHPLKRNQLENRIHSGRWQKLAIL